MSVNVLDPPRRPRTGAGKAGAGKTGAGKKVPLTLLAPPPPEPPLTWGERVGRIAAYSGSFVLHLALFLVLASISFVIPGIDVPQITSTLSPEELEQFKVENVVTEVELGNDGSANMESPSMAATSAERPMAEELLDRIAIADFAPPAVSSERIELPSDTVLAADFDATGLTEHPGGVEGAIDILTREIAAALRERETLVVWLFDASGSLEERRNAIADRFGAVYEQLGATEDVDTSHLLTAVASFGADVNLITPEPVADAAVLVDRVKSIPEDDSGRENVFGAVNQLSAQFLTQRTRQKRNVLFVIVTDERGDDFNEVEPVLAKLRRYGMKVYCVGNAAPFGREQNYVYTTWKEGEYTYQDFIPVDAGPETVAMERLQLAFWGDNRDLRTESMSSGYGPYALTRLCVETGGMFLVAGETGGPTFDTALMRSYPPDYRPIAVYERELSRNRAKQALINAAQKTRVNQTPTPRLSFPATDDTVLRRAITEAQKPAAVFEYPLIELQQILEQGGPDRAKLTEPRWRAGYDLAVGRVLALRARALGYNTVLADMKSAPKEFEDKKSNQWKLVPADTVDAGGDVTRLVREATDSLSRVIDEHPGTPWASLAERELSQPMGWRWEENFNPGLAGPGTMRPGNENIFAPEERAERERMMRNAKPEPKNRPKL